MTFVLSKQAKQDLIKIAIYTEETWGIKQRDIYLTYIDKAFHIVAKHPGYGSSCDDIRSGYFKYYIKKHMIFYYKIDRSSVKIIRVMHKSMDVGGVFLI